MDIQKLKNAKMLVVEAVRETTKPEKNRKLLYKLKVESVFVGEGGLPKAFFSGDVWSFDATGHATGKADGISNLSIALHDLPDESALAEAVASAVDTLLFSSMVQNVREKDTDKLLWVDGAKLDALQCADAGFVTTKVAIAFKHYM